MPGQIGDVLLPITPQSWIVDRLREHQPLLDLLGSGDFPTAGQSFTHIPIFKAGEVPPDRPARFVVVRAPRRHVTDYYLDLAPRSMESNYLVWAETQTDRLPAGHDLDMILTPIFQEIARALLGSTVPIENPNAIGGRVLQLAMNGAYTPEPVTLTESVKVGQMGHFLYLFSTK